MGWRPWNCSKSREPIFWSSHNSYLVCPKEIRLHQHFNQWPLRRSKRDCSRNMLQSQIQTGFLEWNNRSLQKRWWVKWRLISLDIIASILYPSFESLQKGRLLYVRKNCRERRWCNMLSCSKKSNHKIGKCNRCGEWVLEETTCPSCCGMVSVMFSCAEGIKEINNEIAFLKKRVESLS